jgi:glycosyltransferase involved in cell wall biosynthesis
MNIGIDVRLQHQTGVGRYIRNLMEYLPVIDKKNSYFFLKPAIPWHSVQEQILLPSVIRKAHIDLMHFPYFSLPFFLPTPFVITVHDTILNHLKTGKASTKSPFFYEIKHYSYRILLKKAVTNARAIIVPSNTTRDFLGDTYPFCKNKIHVIYQGSELSEKIKNTGANSKIPDPPFFLYVGNAYPHKNLDFLLNTFKEFIGTHKALNTYRLVLAGKKDYFYEKLRKKVLDEHLENSVVFFSDISDKTLLNLYKNATVLITPSLMEGFGLPGIEAMRYDCPVLASRIPVYTEIYGDTAFYFDPRDKNSLIEQMIYVTDPKNTDRIKKQKIRGKAKALLYTWKETVYKTYNVYESCNSL